MRNYDFVKNGVSYTFTSLPDMPDADIIALIPETKESVSPTPVPTPNPVSPSGLKVAIVKKDFASMDVSYANGSLASATLKIRVGSVDRPDRIVASGKTALSTYTTTVKTGFAGQRMVVTHVESNTLIFDQVL
jgi:hypothetical protein